MRINDANVKFSEEDRLLLKKFFSDNIDFISSKSFLEYENIKLFGDLYEQFIDENNLRDNDILMLFLAEIRYDQLAYKVTNESIKRRALRLAIPKERLNDTIVKWYQESLVVEYAELPRTSKDLEAKLRHNEYVRQKSLEKAKNFIVK